MVTNSHGKSADIAVASDVFLSVTTKTAGALKGECTTAGHVGEIAVHGWQWGIRSPTDISTGLATSRRIQQNLVIHKGIDSSSTSLMSALSNNDEVKEAVLSMRKAGGTALEYFKMTLNRARVVLFTIEVTPDGIPTERIEFAFQTISVEYQTQSGDGISGGTRTYNDDWAAPGT